MTAPKKLQRVKMRAVQDYFHKDHIVREHEVFIFEGYGLPPESTAVRADPDEPLGYRPPVESLIDPPWTTQGYVKNAHQEQGRRSATQELME